MPGGLRTSVHLSQHQCRSSWDAHPMPSSTPGTLNPNVQHRRAQGVCELCFYRAESRPSEWAWEEFPDVPECDGEGQGAKAPELTCQDCKNKENKLKKWENERGKCRACCWPWRREESWPGRRWNFTAGFSERGTGSRVRTANELQERP